MCVKQMVVVLIIYANPSFSPVGEAAERSLVQVHDGVVVALVAVHHRVSVQADYQVVTQFGNLWNKKETTLIPARVGHRSMPSTLSRKSKWPMWKRSKAPAT